MDYELINVGMNEVKSTSKKGQVIGTQAIATCISVLIYEDKLKEAIVGHFVSNKNGGKPIEDAFRIFYELHDEIFSKGFNDKNIKYLIVPGIIGNKDRIDDVVSKLNMLMSDYTELERMPYDIMMDVETESLEFVFDPDTACFVTKYFFPEDINYHHKKRY